MVKKRRRHTAAFKFRVALEALEGSKTISQLSGEHLIHANLIRAWKRQLVEHGPSVFAGKGERNQLEQDSREAELNQRIEQLKMEVDWLKSRVAGSGREESRQPIAGMKRSAFDGTMNCWDWTGPPSTLRRRPTQQRTSCKCA